MIFEKNSPIKIGNNHSTPVKNVFTGIYKALPNDDDVFSCSLKSFSNHGRWLQLQCRLLVAIEACNILENLEKTFEGELNEKQQKILLETLSERLELAGKKLSLALDVLKLDELLESAVHYYLSIRLSSEIKWVLSTTKKSTTVQNMLDQWDEEIQDLERRSIESEKKQEKMRGDDEDVLIGKGSIRINDCDLTDKQLELLLDLPQLRYVSSLNLNTNQLSGGCIPSIVQWLKGMSTIKSLCLNNNPNIGGKSMFRNVDPGITLLAQQLKNTSIEELHLFNCGVTDDDVTVLLDNLGGKDSSLRVLNLRGNNSISNKSAETMRNFVENSNILTFVATGLPEKEKKQIAEILQLRLKEKELAEKNLQKDVWIRSNRSVKFDIGELQNPIAIIENLNALLAHDSTIRVIDDPCLLSFSQEKQQWLFTDQPLFLETINNAIINAKVERIKTCITLDIIDKDKIKSSVGIVIAPDKANKEQCILYYLDPRSSMALSPDQPCSIDVKSWLNKKNNQEQQLSVIKIEENNDKDDKPEHEEINVNNLHELQENIGLDNQSLTPSTTAFLCVMQTFFQGKHAVPDIIMISNTQQTGQAEITPLLTLINVVLCAKSGDLLWLPRFNQEQLQRLNQFLKLQTKNQAVNWSEFLIMYEDKILEAANAIPHKIIMLLDQFLPHSSLSQSQMDWLAEMKDILLEPVHENLSLSDRMNTIITSFENHYKNKKIPLPTWLFQFNARLRQSVDDWVKEKAYAVIKVDKIPELTEKQANILAVQETETDVFVYYWDMSSGGLAGKSLPRSNSKAAFIIEQMKDKTDSHDRLFINAVISTYDCDIDGIPYFYLPKKGKAHYRYAFVTDLQVKLNSPKTATYSQTIAEKMWETYAEQIMLLDKTSIATFTNTVKVLALAILEISIFRVNHLRLNNATEIGLLVDRLIHLLAFDYAARHSQRFPTDEQVMLSTWFRTTITPNDLLVKPGIRFEVKDAHGTSLELTANVTRYAMGKEATTTEGERYGYRQITYGECLIIEEQMKLCRHQVQYNKLIILAKTEEPTNDPQSLFVRMKENDRLVIWQYNSKPSKGKSLAMKEIDEELQKNILTLVNHNVHESKNTVLIDKIVKRFNPEHPDMVYHSTDIEYLVEHKELVIQPPKGIAPDFKGEMKELQKKTEIKFKEVEVQIDTHSVQIKNVENEVDDLRKSHQSLSNYFLKNNDESPRLVIQEKHNQANEQTIDKNIPNEPSAQLEILQKENEHLHDLYKKELVGFEIDDGNLVNIIFENNRENEIDRLTEVNHLLSRKLIELQQHKIKTLQNIEIIKLNEVIGELISKNKNLKEQLEQLKKIVHPEELEELEDFEELEEIIELDEDKAVETKESLQKRINALKFDNKNVKNKISGLLVDQKLQEQKIEQTKELKHDNAELKKLIKQQNKTIGNQKEEFDLKLQQQEKQFGTVIKEQNEQIQLLRQMIPAPQNQNARPENNHEQTRDDEPNPNIPHHNFEHQQIDQNNAQNIDDKEQLFPKVKQSPRKKTNKSSMAILINRERRKTFPPISISKITMEKSCGNSDDEHSSIKNLTN